MRIQIPGNFILFCPDALPLLLDLLCFLLCPVPASADSSLLIFKILVQIGTKKVAVETVCPVFLDVFGLVLPKVGIDDLGYSAKPQVQFAELCLCFLLRPPCFLQTFLRCTLFFGGIFEGGFICGGLSV